MTLRRLYRYRLTCTLIDAGDESLRAFQWYNAIYSRAASHHQHLGYACRGWLLVCQCGVRRLYVFDFAADARAARDGIWHPNNLACWGVLRECTPRAELKSRVREVKLERCMTQLHVLISSWPSRGGSETLHGRYGGSSTKYYGSSSYGGLGLKFYVVAWVDLVWLVRTRWAWSIRLSWYRVLWFIRTCLSSVPSHLSFWVSPCICTT